MSLWQWLEALDKKAFSAINFYGALPFLDLPMRVLRNAYTWIPLYVFMLYWLIRYAKERAWQFALLTVCSFACTDYISSSILKPLVGRKRPCYDQTLNMVIHKLEGCGGMYSMPSSHASNHFGLATFWFCAIFYMTGKRWYWLYLWALLVCYAQIYVGKHFPLDILAGAGLGTLIGWILARVFYRWQIAPQRL
ncbi:MAG: phosphatase PAP2 family protein [Williamsia sp.]|nr:phosphatase PAP2 family protein [Williamsia sp.]